MHRWCDEKTELSEMIIEFGKMKQIVSDWCFDTFGCRPIKIGPKGSYKIINFLIQKDTFKVSMDIFVSEVNVIDHWKRVFSHKTYNWGGYTILDDACVIIQRVWMAITDLNTNKRKQHDILTPVEHKDRLRLLYDMTAAKMCDSVTDCDINPLKLRDQLEENSKWMKQVRRRKIK